MTTTIEAPVWSKSKSAAFKECERKFYYLSLNKPSLTPEADPDWLNTARSCKNIKSRRLWSASVLHDAVGEVCKTLRQGEPLPDETRFIHSVRDRMRLQFSESQKNQGTELHLFEHAYHIQTNPSLWQRQWEQVEASLRWFFHSPWVGRLKNLGPEHWKAVDDLFSFDVEGVKVYTKIDCALEVEGRLILIDWKSSKPRENDEKALYLAGIYALEVWEADPENMLGTTVSLLDGAKREVKYTFEALETARYQLLEEAQTMHTFLEQKGYDIEAVPMTENQETCFRCEYQKVCYPKGLSY